MKVNQLADLLGISGDTVRYYSRIGYLKPRKNPINGYKEYRQKDAQRLKFILSARQLGFTVADIGRILDEADRGNTPCPTVRKIINQRLQETEQKFAEAMALYERMKAASSDWEKRPDKHPTGDMICHLIEDFSYQGEEANNSIKPKCQR